MGNIAIYQEGYNDGYTQARQDNNNHWKDELTKFYNDNYEPEINAPFCKGYNMALDHLIQVMNDILGD